ncbi:MAG: GNAT family N-acetyltransferase [Rhizobiales bacterium]|nr:GNAT family N-acetyltransferase [Hyphomicrobiales bacterium]
MLRDITHADLPELLELNQAHVTELSSLSLARLRELVQAAFLARCADSRGAFLLTFDQDADYDSPNFIWFKENYGRFVYVDRIVVSPTERGQGLAAKLYKELFEIARAGGHSMICCEVNSDPPNPGSDRFHEALGFEEAGHAHLPDRGKSVRYLVCKL